MIYLASSSPRRAALLRQVGIEYTVIEPHIDERPRPAEPGLVYARRMAREKCLTGLERIAAAHQPEGPVLAADTVVLLGDEILHKPDTDSDARELLRRLSGSEHGVLTALCLGVGKRLRESLCASRVTFKFLRDAEIDAYCRTGEPLGKAGGYAIQGRAAFFIRRLEGSYSGVMGLPLYELGEMLSAEGLL